MRKTYFKPVSELIDAETIQHIAHSFDEPDGKENIPDGNGGGNNNGNDDQDIWNSHFNIWD